MTTPETMLIIQRGELYTQTLYRQLGELVDS